MIRAVIFDMYETLVTLMTDPRCFSGQMASIAGADVAAFRSAWRRTEDARMQGTMTFEKAVLSALTECGMWSEAAYAEIIRRRTASREICPERLHPRILPMLAALRQHGLRIGLITNCQSEEALAIRGSVLWPCFDAPVLSCETGVMKPDPAIFRLCTDALGVKAEECLYVGDGGSQELTAARSLGMRALQATWYMQGDPDQPVKPMADFPQAADPMEVLDHLT